MQNRKKHRYPIFFGHLFATFSKTHTCMKSWANRAPPSISSSPRTQAVRYVFAIFGFLPFLENFWGHLHLSVFLTLLADAVLVFGWVEYDKGYVLRSCSPASVRLLAAAVLVLGLIEYVWWYVFKPSSASIRCACLGFNRICLRICFEILLLCIYPPACRCHVCLGFVTCLRLCLKTFLFCIRLPALCLGLVKCWWGFYLHFHACSNFISLL